MKHLLNFKIFENNSEFYTKMYDSYEFDDLLWEYKQDLEKTIRFYSRPILPNDSN